MMLNFAILQVDSSRQHLVEDMWPVLSKPSWSRVAVDCIDGRLFPAGLPGVAPGLRKGHVGVWYTALNAMSQAPILTIEDDAVLSPNFVDVAESAIQELPEDADFLALFTHPALDHMFTQRHEVAGLEWIARCFNPNGGVAMYYTSKGASRVRELIKRDGLMEQFDNQLCQYSWSGELNGYSLKPQHRVVNIADVPSIIQETDHI